jgi:hypothetical protein
VDVHKGHVRSVKCLFDTCMPGFTQGSRVVGVT